MITLDESSILSVCVSVDLCVCGSVGLWRAGGRAVRHEQTPLTCKGAIQSSLISLFLRGYMSGAVHLVEQGQVSFSIFTALMIYSI